MPLPRFRLRTLMLAVVVAAMVVATVLTLNRRSARFRALAKYHFALAVQATLTHADGSFVESHLTPLGREAKQRWHIILRDKYERAARYPWLPVAPDPPEPTP